MCSAVFNTTVPVHPPEGCTEGGSAFLNIVSDLLESVNSRSTAATEALPLAKGPWAQNGKQVVYKKRFTITQRFAISAGLPHHLA